MLCCQLPRSAHMITTDAHDTNLYSLDTSMTPPPLGPKRAALTGKLNSTSSVMVTGDRDRVTSMRLVGVSI